MFGSLGRKDWEVLLQSLAAPKNPMH